MTQIKLIETNVLLSTLFHAGGSNLHSAQGDKVKGTSLSQEEDMQVW